MTDISFILPCRNEEKTIGICIDKIKRIMSLLKNKKYEIVVSDSSKDSSAKIALKKGCKVVKHRKGYGDAYLQGMKAAKGDVWVMGDSDNTYDFLELPKLLKQIKKHDLVLGKRKYLQKGAMPLYTSMLEIQDFHSS